MDSKDCETVHAGMYECLLAPYIMSEGMISCCGLFSKILFNSKTSPESKSQL